MEKVSGRVSESLSEYLILPDWIKAPPDEVSLKTSLGEKIQLEYPLVTARMQCVVGPRMAVSAGRNGILTMVPRSLRDADKQAIIDANNKARLSQGDLEFQEDPVSASPEDTLDDVVRIVGRTGHSVIPVIDRKSELFGVYIHDPDNPPLVPGNTSVIDIMHGLRDKDPHGIKIMKGDMPETEIRRELARCDRKFMPILDSNGVLQKIAFLQKFNTNYTGIAVRTKGDWKSDIGMWGPQVDTMCIDSSNACFSDALKILKYAKEAFPDKPFGIGNIVRGKHFTEFAKAGADYIIAGMGVGSICQTGSTRGNGRGQMTAAVEIAAARDAYASTRYVPLVIDGGIRNVKDMTVALAFADLIMMGNYFARFWESPAQKFDGKENPTNEEGLAEFVETWGEGHPRARLVALYGMNFRQAIAEQSSDEGAAVAERYGHSSIAGATVEGVVGLAPYKGRLKPGVEHDARYIRTTMSNAGAVDLKTFRENAVVEKASAMTVSDMLPHDIKVTEK